MMFISKKFNFQYPLELCVKEADSAMLQIEWDSLMLQTKNEIKCLSQQEAKVKFLEYFHYLDAARR